MSIWHLVQSPGRFFLGDINNKIQDSVNEYGNFTLLICVELLGCMTQSCSDKNVEWDTFKSIFPGHKNVPCTEGPPQRLPHLPPLLKQHIAEGH